MRTEEEKAKRREYKKMYRQRENEKCGAFRRELERLRKLNDVEGVAKLMEERIAYYLKINNNNK